jgi:catechol 2,3-dioxygenase-like lactoylglutathione lyase family enzyme
MSDHEVKMIILSTDDLDESIRFYSESLGMSLKFRDGAHFAALDGGPITIPYPGRWSSGSRPLMSTLRPRRLRPVVAAL